MVGRFTQTLLKFGYQQSQSDWIVQSLEKRLTVLIVYVDGIIVIGDGFEEIHQLKSRLAKEFEIKDLGDLIYFLGIEVARSKNRVYIS